MRTPQTLLIAAIFILIATTSAIAKGKRAFLVGIDTYDNLKAEAQLKKAVGDARAMGSALQELGYIISSEYNVSRSKFNERWQQFLETIKQGDQVAFAFSGHGVEINGANYLLPRDVPRIRYGRDEQLKRESIAVSELLADLRERKPSLSLIVLDACRDNPFAEGTRTIGSTRGLARVEPPEGTFIMFSAGANQTALDRLSDEDKDPTSIFTRTLLPLLRTPGVSLLDMADRVGEQVRELAGSIGHHQTPAFYSGVVGGRKVCMAGCEAGAVNNTGVAISVAQLQRGLAVYREACASCHSLKGFTVVYNEADARAANNGALPPQLSVGSKSDIDAIYAFLTAYSQPPARFKLTDGMFYNNRAQNKQTAMPPPFVDGQIDYRDGSPTTVAQYAKDVTLFIASTSNPDLLK